MKYIPFIVGLAVIPLVYFASLLNGTPEALGVFSNPFLSIQLSTSTATNGYVLSTDGTNNTWVAQTGGGSGSSNWLFNGSRLSPTTTVGIGVFASSTIGDGTATGGLTIAGGATTTGNAYFGGSVYSDEICLDGNCQSSWFGAFQQGGPIAIRPHGSVTNPVLTASDVTDGTGVTGVADPFIVYDQGTFYMFFETIEASSVERIGLATSSDGLNWNYDQIVVDDGANHLAYPFVFKNLDTWYMIPDQSTTFVKIWTTNNFPYDWAVAETATTTPYSVADFTPVYWNDRWYGFVYDVTNDQKRLFYADVGESITGRTWTQHPSSPIMPSGNGARMGGRPIVHEHYVDMVYQNSNQQQTRVYRVTDLSTTTFSQTELSTSPVNQRTGLSVDWNGDRAHHMDALIPYIGGPSIVAVDGDSTVAGEDWSIGIYTVAEPSIYLPGNITTRGTLAVGTTTAGNIRMTSSDATSDFRFINRTSSRGFRFESSDSPTAGLRIVNASDVTLFQLLDTADSMRFSGVSSADMTGNVTYLMASGSNFGISSSTPRAKLTVTNAGSQPSFTVEDSSSPDSTPFIIDATGNVGVGTTTPSSLLQTFSTGTSTVSVDSNSTSKGGCLELKDRDGTGYTYITASNGVLTATTTSCK